MYVRSLSIFPGTAELPTCAIDSDASLSRDKGFQIRSFLSQLVGWPAKVICGHLILQLATWIFFATIQKRGFIRLRSLGPDWFNTLATVIHWVFTTLSTGLAFASS
jgi:hypothetical protein